MLHMGWFVPGWSVQASPSNGWTPALNGPFAGRHERDWMKPGLYVDLATSLERAGFDFILIEDSNPIDSTFRGSSEWTLREGIFAPKNDPMPLVPVLAEYTTHIGLVPTVSSTFYPPYLAARLFTTLDHLTQGGVGFNLVTSLSNEAALNYGMESLPSKDIRYDMAGEWVDIFKGLQSSWDADAVVADPARGIYADYSKVHRIDYVGKYFKSRGPLNTQPGPQGRIPMVEAGNSPAGRDLAARHAEVILSSVSTVEQMKAFREDMAKRVAGYGRPRDSLKVLFLANPILGMTDEEARQRAEASAALLSTPKATETMLWFLDQMTGLDFGNFDLDMPVGEIAADLRSRSRQATISTMEKLFEGAEHKTLREVLSGRRLTRDLGLIGSPETVAAKMDEMMQEVGGDGFLLTTSTSRLAIAEIVDGLAPALHRRGLLRDSYSGTTLRENLLAF